jgi:hypothetical protein
MKLFFLFGIETLLVVMARDIDAVMMMMMMMIFDIVNSICVNFGRY